MNIDIVMKYLQYEIVGDMELWRVLAFFLIILLALTSRRLFDSYLGKVLNTWARHTKFKYDDFVIKAIDSPISALFITMGFYFAMLILAPDYMDFIHEVLRVALSLIGAWLLYRLTDLIYEIIRDYMAESDEAAVVQFAPLIRQSLRITIVVIAGIMIIQNLGYSVGSLLAGLGIGGLAIALAAQDTLANLFGTFVMFTDRPFKVGDWIEFKGFDGDVEMIGFRSTRIRTWAKSQVTVPNKLFAAEIIENWSAMPKRRVKMTIGLTYDTPPDKMDEFITRVRELLANDPDINQEFTLVNFTDFGPASLDILIYYFTKTTRWAEYLEIRQRINLAIMRIVHEMGLSFAFPSRTIYFGDRLGIEDGKS